MVLNGANLGIGTTSPYALLELSSASDTDYSATTKTDAQLQGGTTLGLLNTNTDDENYAQILFRLNQTNTAIARIVAISESNNNVDLAFVSEGSDNTTEKLRIKAGGNVGIGTDDPNTKLVVLASGANGIELERDAADATNSSRMFFDSSDGCWSFFNQDGSIKFSDGATPNSSSGTARYAIYQSEFSPATDNGSNLGSDARTWDAVWSQDAAFNGSDQRLKESISDSALGLAFINKLRPVSYKWKDKEIVHPNADGDASKDVKESKTYTRKHYGLIAQEVKAVLDDLSIDTKDFAGYADASKNGGPDKLFLRYTEFIAPLIKAVQELSAKVTALENA